MFCGSLNIPAVIDSLCWTHYVHALQNVPTCGGEAIFVGSVTRPPTQKKACIEVDAWGAVIFAEVYIQMSVPHSSVNTPFAHLGMSAWSDNHSCLTHPCNNHLWVVTLNIFLPVGITFPRHSGMSHCTAVWWVGTGICNFFRILYLGDIRMVPIF